MYLQKKKNNRVYIFDRRYDNQELRAILENTDQILASKDTLCLKKDATTTLGVVSVNGQRLAIKRYNIKGFLHAIKRSVRASRAALCWEHAKALLQAGILTPTPVAMIEKRFGIFRSTAYFINEYVQGEHIRDYLSNPTISNDLKIKTAENIMLLLKKFETFGIVHGDLKPENILIVNQEPVLLDLDSMRVYPKRGWFFRREHQKDINRFMKNWVDYPDINQFFQGLTD
jgi:tRNA A-37 threonylcarbamoyl transferase component Bud32